MPIFQEEKAMERYFTVECHGRAYTVLGNENTTLATVWASQKCWFMYGTKVKITDDKGNSRMYVA